MRTIVMVLGLFLAMGQMANAAPQTKDEAELQITKLFRCTDVNLNGLRNFSTKTSLKQRMERVVRGFETLCSITPRNPEEVKSLQERLAEHSRKKDINL